jgi:ribosomal protein L12E/L44/L45/RPP1/RPP2
MELKINATVNGAEVTTEYILPLLKAKGVDGDVTNVKVVVFSKKSEKDIEVALEDVKFVFNK